MDGVGKVLLIKGKGSASSYHVDYQASKRRGSDASEGCRRSSPHVDLIIDVAVAIQSASFNINMCRWSYHVYATCRHAKGSSWASP